MERLDLFGIITAIMFIPYLLSAMMSPVPSNPTTEDPSVLEQGFLSHVGSYIGLFGVFIVPVGEAAIGLAVARMYLGSYPETMTTLKSGVSHFSNLFCSNLLVGAIRFVFIWFVAGPLLSLLSTSGGAAVAKELVAVVIGTVWILAATYFIVSMMIVVPVIVLEKKGPVAGVQRAWDLSNGNRCYIFCTSFCLGLVFGILILMLLVGGPLFGRFLLLLILLFFPLFSM